MATLSIVKPGDAGLTITFAAAAALGDQFANVGRDNLLVVENGGAGSINVTVTAQTTTAKIAGLGTVVKEDTVLAVAAGAVAIIGPFSDAFNDANGFVQVSYSDVTSVGVAVVKAPRAL